MLTEKKFLIVWLLGFMSGFALNVSGNTLNFWLAKEHIDIKSIGLFALISIPYAINFIWAPVFDTYKLPVLDRLFGQRLSWIVLTQFLLGIAIFVLSRFNPNDNLIFFAAGTFFISFLSSTQDTILGALRTEIVAKEFQGEISGIYIFGYRIGMLLSSSAAIYISSFISWNKIYIVFSLITFSFPLILIALTKYLQSNNQQDIQTTDNNTDNNINFIGKIKVLFSDVLKSIGTIKYILIIIIFLILYRLPDNFIGMMINPFLIHIGYDEFEIATAGKLFGITSAIIGGIMASYIMKRKNIIDSLIIFGILHALAHLLFIVQEIYGKNLYLLFLVTGFESITGGMAMAAYIAFIASLCHGKFRATQYSFFSAMMGLSRSVLPALSGYIVASLGWKIFYLFTTIATIPSLLLLLYLKNSTKYQKAND